jgi:hypothetical protein
MDQFQTLTTASSSSSPSLDDSSMQRSIQLVDDKENGNSIHDIVVDFGTRRANSHGGSRATGDTKPQTLAEMRAANCWKYTIFGLVSL